MIPSTMKAARIHARGAAHFQIEVLPTPKPGPGQVLIRVEAAGVNFSDVKRRRGDVYPFATEFPYVPGSEIAGTVVAHGSGIDGPPIALGELIEDVVARRIRVPAIQTLPLDEATRAHALLEARKVAGKLVIKPWA